MSGTRFSGGVAVLAVLAALAASVSAAYGAEPPPVKSVTIGQHGEFRVNGEPFLPIFTWLQDPRHFDQNRAAGVNAIAGYFWSADSQRGLGNSTSIAEYARTVDEAGFYYIASHMPSQEDAMRQMAGADYLLAWIQGDEPDLPHTKVDATVTPAPHMRVNRSTPYERLVDGVTHSWTAIDPLEGGQFNIKLDKPATIHAVALHLTVSGTMPTASKVTFSAGDRKLIAVDLERKKGQQRFDLPQPAKVETLTVRIDAATESEQAWGSISEVEAFDAEGKNVLLSRPYSVPRATEDDIRAAYRELKQLDPSRPVLMTFTAHFMDEFTNHYNAAKKQRIYPAYVKHCDAIGFDTYPLYGYAMPGWIDYVASGVSQLRRIAGAGKPVYAWIETSNGTQWINIENQVDVEPWHTRAEVWMALIRGATAIGYFTHAWKPSYTQFRPDAEMVAELSRLNGQLTRLAPALLAGPAKRKIAVTLVADGDEKLEGHFKATQHDGETWIFAQNIDRGPNANSLKRGQAISPRAATATFTVEGLRAGTTIEVVDEDRTLTAQDGRFTDRFDGMIEHAYRIRK